MTIQERLEQEFGCAIYAILGDVAKKEYGEQEIEKGTILAIAKKVCFYLDLD